MATKHTIFAEETQCVVRNVDDTEKLHKDYKLAEF